MPNNRDLRLEKYDISTNRYRELKYFCMQYREKQSRLRSITEIASFSGDCNSSGKISDRTANVAMQRMQLEKDIDLIEKSAMEADEELYPYIISNVADGIPYEYLWAPTSRTSFYALRRKFFLILNHKKQ